MQDFNIYTDKRSRDTSRHPRSQKKFSHKVHTSCPSHISTPRFPPDSKKLETGSFHIENIDGNRQKPKIQAHLSLAWQSFTTDNFTITLSRLIKHLLLKTEFLQAQLPRSGSTSRIITLMPISITYKISQLSSVETFYSYRKSLSSIIFFVNSIFYDMNKK